MSDVIVVGAGAAGLSAAVALKRRGIDATVLEKDSEIGGSWKRRYDRLHLHTDRRFSGLAHYRIPRRFGTYPSRDGFVEYLQEYAAHFDLNVVTKCGATKIARQRDGKGWTVTSVAKTFQTPVVVVATGQYVTPVIPNWSRKESFKGTLIHSSDYRNANPFKGKRVLVVGAGNSGTEIATDLADGGATLVALSIRTPPPIVPRDPFGMPVQRSGILLSAAPSRFGDAFASFVARIVFGDLTPYGIQRPHWGAFSAKRSPVIDVGFVSALKQKKIVIRPAVERLTETGALFANGESEQFDAIVAATGFTTGLRELLESQETLDAAGEPIALSGEPTSLPGMYFLGFTHTVRGYLFEANLASKRLARNVERYLVATPAPAN